jgi:hypothetical protein
MYKCYTLFTVHDLLKWWAVFYFLSLVWMRHSVFHSQKFMTVAESFIIPIICWILSILKGMFDVHKTLGDSPIYIFMWLALYWQISIYWFSFSRTNTLCNRELHYSKKRLHWHCQSVVLFVDVTHTENFCENEVFFWPLYIRTLNCWQWKKCVGLNIKLEITCLWSQQPIKMWKR